jgi:lipid-binding SYLF domain-containing protein
MTGHTEVTRCFSRSRRVVAAAFTVVAVVAKRFGFSAASGLRAGLSLEVANALEVMDRAPYRGQECHHCSPITLQSDMTIMMSPGPRHTLVRQA